MLNILTGKQILRLPMEENDAKASTIKQYLKSLLQELWFEQEGFSGKRPFGNSGWEYDLYKALVKGGVIDGEFDEEGYLIECDSVIGHNLIMDAIKSL